MKKAISLFTAIFCVSAFAVELYTSEEIVSYSPSFSTILHPNSSAEDSDSNAYVPFLPGYNAGPEGSEPDEFLDEASSVDEMESSENALAEAQADTIHIDMTQAAVPLESGRITSPFGFRHYRIHKGIDIGLQRGDSIRAAFPGRVTRVRYERRGYGRYIVLEHENCGITRTVYAHLSKQLVKVGQTVEAGEVIGLGGSTGRSTGPHLHFEMRIGDIPLNPVNFFDFQNHTYTQADIQLPTAVFESEYAALQKEASKHRYHKVRPGDTLGKIARMYHTSVNKLLQLNGLKRNSVLRVGRIIRCS
ncbi:MAG: peptidoglycan DD-metalloendopeptidase family protein [Fibrobacter sp.]|nr:peptidoglycan DD-metalloendopeptidase family protein [Fibrobacter sp.]